MPILFNPISDPLISKAFYLIQYSGNFIYFTSHAIKKQLKNVATLKGASVIRNGSSGGDQVPMAHAKCSFGWEKTFNSLLTNEPPPPPLNLPLPE